MKFSALLFLLFAFLNNISAQTFTTSGGVHSTGSSSIVCAAGVYSNSNNINSTTLADWVDFSLIAGVGCSYWIHSTLNGNATANTYAGFHIRSGNILNLLTGMQIRTYQSGVLQETVSGGSLLSILSGTEGDVYFHTSQPYNEVRLVVSGLVSVAYNLDIFYGFGSANIPDAFVLPLRFSPLQANRDGEEVNLNFRLWSAEKLSSIVLERSSNGKEFFPVQIVAKQDGEDYRLKDKHTQTAYYRVKASASSKNEYSTVIKVEGTKAGLQMQIVSANGGTAIRLFSPAPLATTIHLADASGRTLFTRSKTIDGYAEIYLPTTIQKTQLYFVSVITANGRKLSRKVLL